MKDSSPKEPMPFPLKVLLLLASVIVLLYLGIVVAYWWANTIPARPKGVGADAVFIWAPRVGVPAPRRGWWIACWESEGKNWCRVSSINGTTEHEGEFIPYRRKVSITNPELEIDVEQTEGADGFLLGSTRVRLVYLANGDVLIPAEKYDEGRELLRKRESWLSR
jgi:hypothetical protein